MISPSARSPSRRRSLWPARRPAMTHAVRRRPTLGMEQLENRQVLSAATVFEPPATRGADQVSDRSLVPAGDRYEPNDTRQTATNLGTVSGSLSVADLDTDYEWFLPATSADVDFFRFATTSTGTSAHYVDVLFTHTAGDIDARLLDSSGNVLTTSTGSSNSERLSLQGRPAGTYFLQVYGFSGARNSYRLAFQAPGGLALPADRYETNDTRQTATDLATVSGARTIADLSIHTASDRDFFKFITTGAGTSADYIDVLFSQAAGDVDAQLLDAEGNVLTSSTGTSDNERLSLQGRAAGTYFVEVFGFSSARNSYQLAFQAPAAPAGDRYETNDTRQTATDLAIVSGARTIADLSIHTASDRDFFQFVTAGLGTSADYIDVLFSHAAGDVDAQLLDSAGNVLASSTGASDNERISLQGLPAGTYYIEVYGYSGARNSYRLAFQAPAAPAGDRYETNDTRQTATDLAIVSGARTIADLSIHTASDRDFFKFVTTGAGTSADYVDVLFPHAAGDIDAQLLDAEGNVLTSSTGTSDNERLSLQGRAAGTYFVEVFGFASARNSYRLAFQAPAAPAGDRYETNDTRQTATDLRTISGAITVADLSIHTTSDRDFFKFVTTGPGTSAHYVDVLFSHAAGDIDARLLDTAGNVLASSTGASDSERLSLQGLPAGTYYLEVYGYSGDRNAYQLAFEAPPAPSGTSGDRYEANDTRQTATDLRTISGAVTVADLSIHTTSDRDFFKFVTTGPGTSAHYVDVLFSHAAGDVDAQLLDANGNVLTSSTGTSDSERLSLQGLPAGTYFIEVYGYSGDRNSYRLAFQAPGAPAADRYEPNNTRQTATDLRTISGSLSLADLSITANDRDFFRFTLAAAATSTHAVTASFAHAAGNLEMRLLDAQGNAVRSSLGTTDNERISLEGLGAGTYFVEVFGATSAVTNSYQLAFATPLASQPGGPTTDAWTIMVYVTASTLDRFAYADINEMEKAVARLPGTVNLSVFWDQSSTRTTYPTGNGAQPAWGTAGRGFIVADANMNSVATTFEILPEANTGSPQTLTDFITWSTQQAPAQRYAVILWDHGAGLEGFNFDDSDGSSRDNLTTAELNQSLTTLRGNGISIDLLSFDACMMGMTEVGYATRNLATTFVASQEIEAGNGHDYTTLFRPLESDPYAATPATLATGFVRSYGDQYVGSADAQDGADTHSAILSSRYDTVVTALRSFTTAAANATASDRTAMATARNATPSYTQDYFRDLGGFMQRIVNTSSINAGIRTAATGVVNAVAQAVISKTADRRGSSGMSIYLPQLGSTIATWYSSQYASFDAATGWSTFVSGAAAAGRNVAVDWSGAVNTLAARAYDLGLVTGSGLEFDHLSLIGETDQDWFRFSIGGGGAVGNRIVAQPVGIAGSVAVELYDVAGTTRLATGTAGQISLAGLPAGQYSLRVASPNIVERYRLTFDAPGVDALTAVPNSTLDKAFQLGVISGQQQFTGFVSLNAVGSGPVNGGWSFYTFEAAPAVGQQTISLEIRTPEGVSLEAAFLDDDGQTVQSTSGTGVLSLSLPLVGSGDRYTLRVRQTPARTAATAAAFSAVFSVSTASAGEDIALSATVISENRPAGTAVGTLSASIPFSNGNFTYALVAGDGATDNSAFALNGDQLITARPFNWEVRRVYSVRVRATDGGGQSTERSFTIRVTDVVNEPLVVESVNLPSPATYGAGQPILFAVTLSQRVTVGGRPQVAVRAGNVSRAATYVAGSGSAVLTFQYVVGAADSFDVVTLGQRFIFPAGTSIATGALRLPAQLPAGIAGAVAPGVRIDGRPPRVIGSVSVPTAGTYTVGRSLDFTVRFSEAVIVTGSAVPSIGLRGMNAPRTASYVSGSGSTNLTFRYTVMPGDAIVSPAGLSLGSAIALPPTARLTDAAGNRAQLGIVAPSLRLIRIDTRVLASLALPQAAAEPAAATGRLGARVFARLG